MQTVSSAKTSRNQIPALHRKLSQKLHGDILDYGGGKYDTAKNWLEYENSTIKVFVYDPYNRSEEHNFNVLSTFSIRKANAVICSNVLNVIKEKSARLEMLYHIKSLADEIATIYFSVYKAKKTSNYAETAFYVGQETADGWQNCQSQSFYMDEIKEVFGYVRTVVKRNGYIAAIY